MATINWEACYQITIFFIFNGNFSVFQRNFNIFASFEHLLIFISFWLILTVLENFSNPWWWTNMADARIMSRHQIMMRISIQPQSFFAVAFIFSELDRLRCNCHSYMMQLMKIWGFFPRTTSLRLTLQEAQAKSFVDWRTLTNGEPSFGCNPAILPKEKDTWKTIIMHLR